MNINDQSEEELGTRKELDESISLKSVTQFIRVTKCVDIWIYEFAIKVTAVLTPIGDCPCVLSLGQVVDESGYEYVWRSGRITYSIKDDFKMYCYTNNNCPFGRTLQEVSTTSKQKDAYGAKLEHHGEKDAGGETQQSPVAPTVKPKRKSGKPEAQEQGGCASHDKGHEVILPRPPAK